MGAKTKANRHDYETCKHPGCEELVNNKKGLCKVHNTVQCRYPGCMTTWIQWGNHIMCGRHRKYNREEVYAGL